MFTGELRAAKPGVFQSMTGVSPKEFQSLLAQVELRYQAMVKSRVERADRKRAPGAGAKSRHDMADEHNAEESKGREVEGSKARLMRVST